MGAIKSGDEAAVDRVLSLCRGRHENGELLNYMLFLAVAHERPTLVTKLFDLGAAINGRGPFNCPLKQLRRMSCTMLRHLLSLGANPNYAHRRLSMSSYDETIADHAMLDATREQIEILIDGGIDFGNVTTFTVHQALCQDDAVWRLGILQQYGVVLSEVSYLDHGSTVAHTAVGAKHPQAVLEFLAERGVNLDVEDDHGMTPLMKAASTMQLQGFRALMRMGINNSLYKTMNIPEGLNTQGASGMNPLAYLDMRYEHALDTQDPREQQLREIVCRDLGYAAGWLQIWRNALIQLIAVNRIRRAMEEREMFNGAHLPGGVVHDAAVASMPWNEAGNEV